MASVFGVAVRTTAAAAVVADVVEVSLHTAEPDENGSNEIATDRQPVTWGSPASGAITAETTPEFSVPGDGTWVRWCGLWAEGDVFVGGIELDTQIEYPAAGTYTISPLRVGVRNPTT